MKQHSMLGAELLGGLNHPFLDFAATIARHHHERWDGSGYPDGLVGVQCSRACRIVGIVDVYDALAQKRCYKAAWSHDAILEFFGKQRGTLFDPELVDAVLDLSPEFEKVIVAHPDSAPERRVAS
jgi:putative two-component system response regulator